MHLALIVLCEEQICDPEMGTGGSENVIYKVNFTK